MDAQRDDPAGKAAEKARINELLARARKGDQTALPQLREFLDANPDVWRQVGDLGEHAREGLIALASHNDLIVAESMRRMMDHLQAELVGDSPSATIRLLAEQCVLCWAQLHWAELLPIGKDSKGSPHGPEVQKRINAIQGRYVQALKTLTTVRGLLSSNAKPARQNLKIVG